MNSFKLSLAVIVLVASQIVNAYSTLPCQQGSAEPMVKHKPVLPDLNNKAFAHAEGADKKPPAPKKAADAKGTT